MNPSSNRNRLDESESDADPWERMPLETPKAWAAFCVYRDMGPHRSLSKLGRNLGRSKANFEPWSVSYDWVERCAVHDAERDAEAKRAAQEAHAAELGAYRERNMRFGKTLSDTNNVLLGIVLVRLKKLANEKDGEEIPIKSLPAFMRTCAALGQIGLDVEAESIGVRQLERLTEGLDDESDEEADT